MAGKCPAVMQRPDDLLTASAQIVKQQTDVDIVAVDIVQPDHIGIIGLHPIQKAAGSCFGTEAVVIQQTAADAMEFIIQGRSDPHGWNIVTVCLFTAEGEHTLVTFRHQLPALLCRDPSGTAKAGNGVDEQVLHGLASIMLI